VQCRHVYTRQSTTRIVMTHDGPRLESGARRVVVLRNLSRLLRAGWSMGDATAAVLAKAGLTQFPPTERPGTRTMASTVHRRPAAGG
jgi:hypothetical protein